MMTTFGTHIETRDDILGGTPIIKGTRLDIYTVHARLKGGDTLKQLADEYRDVPLTAFVEAYNAAQRARP